MKQSIRQRALELGFDDCRFTTATPPDHRAEFHQWLAEKRHGEMGYLERNAHKRVNPQEVLPGAKSVITLAVSYEQPSPMKSDRANHNRNRKSSNPASSPATPVSRITTTSSPND